jgi:hypothetical protein
MNFYGTIAPKIVLVFARKRKTHAFSRSCRFQAWMELLDNKNNAIPSPSVHECEQADRPRLYNAEKGIHN